MVDKEIMNNAIRDVLNARIKGDCKESFRIVSSAYEVYKNSYKGFSVANPKTNKTLTIISRNGRNVRMYKYVCGYPSATSLVNLNKMDFVSFLEKPINANSRACRLMREGRGQSYYKGDRLKSDKWSISYHESCIENAQEEFEKALALYQENIKHHTRELEKSKAQLEKRRREYGLVKGYIG